jgi:hypothetical protein
VHPERKFEIGPGRERERETQHTFSYGFERWRNEQFKLFSYVSSPGLGKRVFNPAWVIYCHHTKGERERERRRI